MAYGGSSEIKLIAGDPAWAPGSAIFSRVSSDVSTDFAGITGYLTGAGATPFRQGVSLNAGPTLGMRVGDLLVHIQTTAAPRPGVVSWHSVVSSTANFSTASASYFSTGSYDVTLSSASTA